MKSAPSIRGGSVETKLIRAESEVQKQNDEETYVTGAFNPLGWHYTALHMSMLGNAVAFIAETVGRTPQAVSRFLASPWAKEQQARFHESLQKQHAQAILDPIQRFTAGLAEKLDILDALTKSEDEKIALAATREWIAHAIGSPVKRTEVSVEHTLSGLSLGELAFVRDHGRLPTAAEMKQITNANYIESDAEVVETAPLPPAHVNGKA